jgi:hypothetical protein
VASDQPSTNPWEVQLSAENARSDFEFLYNGLKSAHANLYVHREKEEYDALYQKTLNQFTSPISLFEARVAFQKFTAYGDVAHARIEFPDDAYKYFRENGGRVFPISLRIVDGRAYVGTNYSGRSEISLGDEILALNGVSIGRWLKRTAAHISADTPYIAHSLLEFSFPRYLWLEVGEIHEFDLELAPADGQPYQVSVPAISHQEQEEAAARLPPAFTLDDSERVSTMLDEKIGYLRPGPFYNTENPDQIWDNTEFTKFIDSAFDFFLEEGAKTLVVDLRDNAGGDSSFSDTMLAWFADEQFRFCSAFLVKSSDEAAASNQARLDAHPAAANGVSGTFAKKYAETPRGDFFDLELPFVEPRNGTRFTGEVYVIVNRHTYSNAVNVASIIQDYGFGTIVGEKTSDMATTYGAMETFTLPHTGITVGFPKAHIIRPSGEKKSDGVTPDWVIESPIRPANNDLVLETLLSGLDES